jgi:hypothetical protein
MSTGKKNTAEVDDPGGLLSPASPAPEKDVSKNAVEALHLRNPVSFTCGGSAEPVLES